MTLWFTGRGVSTCHEVFCKKRALKNFEKITGKHMCQSLFFNKVILAQVFPCEFCKIFQNTFLYRSPPDRTGGCFCGYQPLEIKLNN